MLREPWRNYDRTTNIQTSRRREEVTAVSLASRDTYVVTRLILSSLIYQGFRKFKRKLRLQLFLDILHGYFPNFWKGKTRKDECCDKDSFSFLFCFLFFIIITIIIFFFSSYPLFLIIKQWKDLRQNVKIL
jgi:hypothetical protein